MWKWCLYCVHFSNTTNTTWAAIVINDKRQKVNPSPKYPPQPPYSLKSPLYILWLRIKTLRINVETRETLCSSGLPEIVIRKHAN